MLHKLMYMRDLLLKVNSGTQRTEAGVDGGQRGWARKAQTCAHKTNGSETHRAARRPQLATLCAASERCGEQTVKVLVTRKTPSLCVVVGVDSSW